jgi:hypothetical protein
MYCETQMPPYEAISKADIIVKTQDQSQYVKIYGTNTYEMWKSYYLPFIRYGKC